MEPNDEIKLARRLLFEGLITYEEYELVELAELANNKPDNKDLDEQ